MAKKTAKVGAKILLLPSPGSLMNSSLSRSFFSSRLFPDPSWSHIQDRLQRRCHKPAHIFWSVGPSRICTFLVETFWAKATQSKINNISVQTYTGKTCSPSFPGPAWGSYSRQGTGPTETSADVVSGVNYTVGQSRLHLTCVVRMKDRLKFVFSFNVYVHLISGLDHTDL